MSWARILTAASSQAGSAIEGTGTLAAFCTMWHCAEWNLRAMQSPHASPGSSIDASRHNIAGSPVRSNLAVSVAELLRGAAYLGVMSLSLADILRQQAKAVAAGASAPVGRAKSCIVLFLMGGSSQHATWDPKPNAPAEVRGEVRARSQPACQVCRLANCCQRPLLWPSTYACCARCEQGTTPTRRAGITCSPACRISR